MKRLGESLPSLQTMRERTAEHSETGTPLSETGSVALATTTPGGVELSRATDEELVASLTLVFGSRLAEQTQGFLSDYGYDFRLVGYELTAPATPDQIARARAIVDLACAPMNEVELAKELTFLRAASISNMRDADLEMWMEVMMEDIGDFPAAVVSQACKQWRRRTKFLPGCAELREECHQINSRRRALRRLVGADKGGRG